MSQNKVPLSMKSVDSFYVPQPYGRGTLILVQIPLVSALALSSHFLVCTISCEPVVGFRLFFK